MFQIIWGQLLKNYFGVSRKATFGKTGDLALSEMSETEEILLTQISDAFRQLKL